METAVQQQSLSTRDIREKHREELESLTLASQPLRTLKFFVLAVVQGLHRLFLAKSFRLLLLISSLAVARTIGVLLITDRGHNEMDLVRELLNYLQFGLWWLGLGVASSIGLGSGLHTFVLYLGPHIALFTIKAVQCGRVDIKSAAYDTIQLNSGPSWLEKNCTAFGPPLFSSLEGARVPLINILRQVQLEAILWGIGTALGELPPYFISRAASLSGSEVELLKELDSSSAEDATMFARHMKQIKCWLLSHLQYLNFSTILILASVPNPLFDLAGIMCGQFGVPFWKFFLATLIGKAIIKTHIQTAFIISVCNYQLLDFIENELIRLLSFVPGLSSILPNAVAKLQLVRKKYLEPSAPVSNVEAKRWDVSVSAIWNTVIWLMLISFFVKIVTATAQSFLKEQQEKELVLTNDSPSSSNSSPE